MRAVSPHLLSRLGDWLTSPAPLSRILCPVAVRGIYAYTAQGPDEIDVEEGKLIQLTDGPTGGRSYADGWWEGTRGFHRGRPVSIGADVRSDHDLRDRRKWEEGYFPQQLRKELF